MRLLSADTKRKEVVAMPEKDSNANEDAVKAIEKAIMALELFSKLPTEKQVEILNSLKTLSSD